MSRFVLESREGVLIGSERTIKAKYDTFVTEDDDPVESRPSSEKEQVDVVFKGVPMKTPDIYVPPRIRGF